MTKTWIAVYTLFEQISLQFALISHDGRFACRHRKEVTRGADPQQAATRTHAMMGIVTFLPLWKEDLRCYGSTLGLVFMYSSRVRWG